LPNNDIFDELSHGLIEDILKTALYNGGDYADVFVEETTSTSIHLEDDKIEKMSTGIALGAGIRVVFDGKTAYAHTNDLTPAALLEAARSVSSAVRPARAHSSNAGDARAEDSTFDLSVATPSVDFIISKLPSNVPVSEKIRLLTTANAAARGRSQDLSHDQRQGQSINLIPAKRIESEKIRQVTGSYRDAVQRVLIAASESSRASETSHITLAQDDRVYTTFVIYVTAAHDGVMQTGYEVEGGFAGFELFDDLDIESVALKAASRAITMLSAPRIKGGRMPVVISSEAGGTMIHEAVGHGLEADLAGRGMSVYCGKKGQSIASALITVIDDATMPQRRGSYRFDDEGVASAKNVLVDKGVLTGYMYDRINAARQGASPTGNGRRDSYRSRPIPRMSNTYLAPGSTPPQDIILSVPDGLFVIKMGGGQVNTATGDFVFEVQDSRLIKNGVLGDPVRGATLSGNGPDILNSIDMIGSDLGFSIGSCGKDGQSVPVSDAMPTVRIPEMVVGGEV
jgi:TldD protein